MCVAWLFPQMHICAYADLNSLSYQNSNVVTFFSLLKKDDRNEQMCYYQVRTTS